MSEPATATPFGRYQLVRRIARGGMAEIYLAKQQGPGRFERSLVIKRILPHLVGGGPQGEQFTQMFLDEAALAAQLSHPHIAQVYDFGHEAGTYFIALELVKGPDLRNIVRTAQKLGLAPPPVELSVRIIAEVLGALDYAHHAKNEQGVALNIVHRDVSPQNILVSYDGVAKLVDFGIAKAATSGTETEAGVVKGKYAYLAPEQIKKLTLDGRTDEYAAALVLYELLTLQQALPGEGMEAILAAAEGRISPLEAVRPDLPPELIAVMQKALHRDRDQRYPTCRDLQGELEKLLVGWGLTVQPHDIARYIAELEGQAGEPLSAAVAAQSGSAQPKIETGPRAMEKPVEPAVETGPVPAPRLKTGARPALAPPRPAEPEPEGLRARRPPPRMAEVEPTAPETDAAPEDLNGPTLNGYEPPPRPAEPTRRKTGMRKALEPEAGNQTFIQAPMPAGLDDGEEVTARKAPRARSSASMKKLDEQAPQRARSSASMRQLEVPRESDPTLPPRTPAFREAEKTPPRAQAPKARPSAEKKGGWFGTVVLLLLICVGGAAAVGYAFGLRPADFKGVKTVPQALAVIQAKVGDKPNVPTDAKPLEKPPAPPPAPPPALLPPGAAAPTGTAQTPPAQTPPAQPQPEAKPAVAEKPAEKPEPHKHRVRVEKPEKVEAPPAQAAAQPDSAPAQPTTGIVLITVKPWADVTINGKHLGNSPIPAQELAAGAYEAVFTNPAVDHPVKRKFTVVAGQQVNVDVNMDAP